MRAQFLTANHFLLDKVSSCILVLSKTGRIKYINQQVATIMGYTPQDMLGKNWFHHYLPSKDRLRLKKQFKKWVQESKCAGEFNELHYVVANGGELHMIQWKMSWLECEFLPGGIFCSGTDITEQHLLKTSLAEQKARCHREKANAVLTATERERQLLAHELHDNVNQVLTTCKLLLETVPRNSESSEEIGKACQYIDEVINTLRKLSHVLMPGEMEGRNFNEAINQLVNRINETGRINVKLTVNGKDFIKDLPHSFSISLFRMIQESLSNALKHSHAKEVIIVLTFSPWTVDLEIQDNGKGFDRKSTAVGLGLRSMYLRAEALGGKAYIQTYPGEGTLVSVHLPKQGIAICSDTN